MEARDIVRKMQEVGENNLIIDWTDRSNKDERYKLVYTFYITLNPDGTWEENSV